ncbi:MAG: type II secretion system F family protein [Candidatus Cloacimonetes bacterium]|nr:type II secretion system F family protein [Candidatus Cloacimonadota bacterium]
MLKEFRYTGINQVDSPVQGVVLASNSTSAKKLIRDIELKQNITVNKIDPKRNFIYRIKLPSGKRVKGKQAAFSKIELIQALSRIGYSNAKIEPVLFDFQSKPSFANILMFVNLSSFLLKEQMSYDKILRMLAEEETNPTLRSTLKKIEGELKKGKEGTEVFNRYADVFGKFPAYMLGLATKSGNMSEVYDATAKFMERDMEYKKSLRQALMTPMFTVLAMIAAVLYYIISIFPTTAELFIKSGVEVPPMTAATLQMSDFFAANWWWMALLVIIPIIGLVIWWRTPDGRVWRDRTIIKLPIVGKLLHKSSIEIFCRVFAAIYSGAENNIETIQAAAEACRNAYMEKNIKEITIPLMLKEGMSLVPALSAAKVFNHTTLSRFKTGSETGNVLTAAQQIAKFYEKETTYKMQNLIQSIQTLIGAFIGIVITALTVVSAEIATVSPKTPGM